MDFSQFYETRRSTRNQLKSQQNSSSKKSAISSNLEINEIIKKATAKKLTKQQQKALAQSQNLEKTIPNNKKIENIEDSSLTQTIEFNKKPVQNIIIENNIKQSNKIIENEDSQTVDMMEERKNNLNNSKKQQNQQTANTQFGGIVEKIKNAKRKLPKNLLKQVENIKNEQKQSENNKKIKTELQEKCDNIMNKPSIRQKYEELVQSSTELILPPKYKDILSNFGQIDATLEFFQKDGKIGYFDNLCQEIDNIYKKTMKITHLQQIMFIHNEIYDLEYKFNDKLRKFMLCVKFPTNNKNKQQNNVQRKNEIKNNLIKITQQQHLEFLEEINHKDFALKVKNVWHPKFNLNNVKDIQLQSLPKRPNEVNVQTVAENINVNQQNNLAQKSNFMLNIMKTMADKQQESVQEKKKRLLEEAQKIKLEQGQNKTLVSDNLYKMFKAKQQMKQQETNKQIEQQCQNNHNNKVEYYKSVVQIISMYYRNRNVQSMAMVQVVDHLKQNEMFKLTPKNEIQNTILEVKNLEQCQGFLNIKVNKLIGECLLVNKNADLNKIYNSLKTIN